MKKRLILTVSITVQNDRIWAVNREETNWRDGKKNSKESFAEKSDGMVSRMLRERCALCSVWKRHSRSSLLHQGSTICCSTIRETVKFGNNWDLPTRQRNSTYSPRNARVVFPSFLDKDTYPANSPALNPLDDCIWDELGRVINWNKVTWKSPLIAELKRSVKKIRLDVVRESCSVWTDRLYHMTQKRWKLFKRIKAACLIENWKMNLFKEF